MKRNMKKITLRWCLLLYKIWTHESWFGLSCTVGCYNIPLKRGSDQEMLQLHSTPESLDNRSRWRMFRTENLSVKQLTSIEIMHELQQKFSMTKLQDMIQIWGWWKRTYLLVWYTMQSYCNRWPDCKCIDSCWLKL